MKVYVCYKEYNYEGYSEPLAAFDNEDKAKEWCKKNTKRADYTELEIE